MLLYALAVMTIVIGKNGAQAMDLTEVLGTLAREIVLKYFMELPTENRCLCIITEDNDDLLSYLLPLNITTYNVHISHDEYKFSKPLDTLYEEYIWEPPIMETVNAPCMGYIIQTSDIWWMSKTMGRLWRSETAIQRYNRTFLYLPVVSRLMSDDEFEDHIRTVFEMKEMDFMPDLNVVKVTKEMYVEPPILNTVKPNTVGSPLDNLTIEIVTHKFVSVYSSERISLDWWNRKKGFLMGTNLYPYKMDNLMGKNITLVTINYPPLTVIDWDKDPRTYDGLEPQFIFEWARRLNFTYGWAHDNEFWGHIYKNGSGVGIFGILSMDKADLAFNAFYLWEPEHHFLDYSTSHFKTSIILICPKPKLLPGWMVPILPFSYTMWVAVIISVFGCTTALYIFSVASVRFLARGTGATMANMYSSWIECAFRTTGLLVLQVPPDERDWSTPRFVPMRHLVTWLILFYFVVTTAYCGGLATVLTVPRYEQPIKTPEDLADHNIKWTGLYDAYLISIRDTTNPVMARIVKNFYLEGEGEVVIPWLAELCKLQKYCFVLEKMVGGTFFMPPFITEDTMNYYRIMDEELYSSLAIFGTRKGSPLMHHVNKILGKARDAGLFKYWEDLTVRNYLSTRRQLSVIQSRIQFDEGPTKLQVHHIHGAFYLLAFGLSSGTVIFIFEPLVYKMSAIKQNILLKKKKNASEEILDNYNQRKTK